MIKKFIIGKLPIEVKALRKVYDWNLKNLKYVMKKFKMNEGVLVYLGTEFEEVNWIKVVPFFDICYNPQILGKQDPTSTANY
ncbi:MAG: hypothetical protein ACPLZF_04975 [Nitrososphaeria archaeon]